MRHMAKKKRKPLLSFTNTKQMLHSKNGKSTYFYKQQWFNYLIPALSALTLLLVLGLSINPISTQDNHQAFAETNIDAHSGDIVPENGVALRIDTALNDKDTIEKQVSGSGTQYIKVDFTVGANNVQNYDVYVQADSTALTGTSHGDKLQSITTDSTGTVGTKQWGYGVSRGSVEPSTMTYRPIQTSVSTSADGQDAGEGKTLTGISQPYTLAFAANLEGAAADHYKSNITLSVAVGAEDVIELGFAGITQMQEMDSAICKRAGENEAGRLEDVRDGKIYWVAKLKDDNCWMTQNLDLNIPVAGLNKNTTDIPADWSNDSAYPPVSTTVDGMPQYSATNRNDIYSWDPAQGGAATYCNNGVDVIACKETDNATSSVNDGHDAQGNYYSWGAATAGQAATLTDSSAGQTATQSICPKGWTLPTGGADDKQYNILTNNLKGYQLGGLPYYLIATNHLDDKGAFILDDSAYYWSSSTYNAYGSALWAYCLGSKLDTYSPSIYNVVRNFALSVRCVAR